MHEILNNIEVKLMFYSPVISTVNVTGGFEIIDKCTKLYLGCKTFDKLTSFMFRSWDYRYIYEDYFYVLGLLINLRRLAHI